MISRSKFLTVVFFSLLPILGFGLNLDLGKNLDVLDTYNKKIKGDSVVIVQTLDSAKLAYSESNYTNAISYANKSFELSKKFPNSDFAIQSELILARSYRDIYLKDKEKYAFNNTLRYYLKAITTVESSESKWGLPEIYKEYGDFYASLNLPELTIRNYSKALDLISEGENFELQKELLKKIAALSYNDGKLNNAISFYNKLYTIHNKLYEQQEEIEILKILSELYYENKAYDSAIYKAKGIYNYYRRVADQSNQVTYLSKIGEISYQAGNRDQADKFFKSYFSLVKKDENLWEQEIASLRYINNLITEGDIYTWSTENGYLSDYETAIRFYNEAQKNIDFENYPDLASRVLNRTGSIYYKLDDFKTCITYFNLALFYAKKSNDKELASENHIMLARAYDAIERWKDASLHYEFHAAYKDSIIHQTEMKQLALDEELIESEKEKLKVEQTLDRIETQERQELAFVEKELRNIALENELELYRQEVTLNEMLIQNQKLAEDSAVRNYLLAKEQLENERNSKKIEQLNSEREKQDLLLRNKEAEQENERQQIKILEQENSLAKSQQAYYVLSIVLISLILIFIIVIYIQKRKANLKLRLQNEKIEIQAEKLKQAYQNLELLSTIGRDITSSLIIEEIIETVYENLNTLMDASVLGIGVFDRELNRLHFPGVREKNQRLSDIHIDLSTNRTLAAFCFNTQNEIIVDNYYGEYAAYIQPEQIPVPGDGNSTSIVYLPLTIGNKKLGVLTVQSFDEAAFNAYHINLIRNIAIYAKIALENASVYRELENQSIHLQQANKNIGEQNKLIEEQYQQLLAINEEKNILIKILAHDLRNPLATAMSMTELVRFEKSNLSAEQYQASEIIWRGLNRMDEMIRKILDIKAIESQKVNLDFEILNANDFLNPLEKMFVSKAEEKGINLYFYGESSEPLIKADRNYLIQVMENLISNALKFSPPKRNVYVRIYEEAEVVRFSIRDEGPGIPENELIDLFKKYHKLTPRPTAGEQSVGLGLSIVKKYTELMHGKVWCRSKEGEGSEFIVEFQKEAVAIS